MNGTSTLYERARDAMMNNQAVIALVVAAGKGERAGASDGIPKQYRSIGGKPMLTRAVDALLAVDAVDAVRVVIGGGQEALYADAVDSDPRVLPPVVGGATRQASVLAGLQALEHLAPALVLIHDAARPFASPELIGEVIRALGTSQSALPVIAVTDTIKRSWDGRMAAGTEDRRTLFAAQTPQGFRYPEILAAHRRAAAELGEFTDDAAIAEWAGLEVALTAGSSENFKVTLPGDFARAEQALGGKAMETRIGSGFDVHPFEAGDTVWLGGVGIPHDRRLKGHSDADAALHALCDAIYGALGEGDIGTHFPPSDPQWRGAASTVFLKHASEMVAARGGRIVNLDITIVCEAPRIMPHVAAMKAAIAGTCGISTGRVAIKATTSEQLGFTGRREGLMAMASASIELPRED